MLHEQFAQEPRSNHVTRSCAVQLPTQSDELSSNEVCNARGEKITIDFNVVPVYIIANGKEVKTNTFFYPKLCS